MSEKELHPSKKNEEKKPLPGLPLKRDNKNRLKDSIVYFQDDYNFIVSNPFSDDEIDYPTVLFPPLEEEIKKNSKDNQSLANLNCNIDKNSTKDEELIRDLCKGFSNQPYKLMLKSDIERPMYKDRAFSLVFEVVDSKKVSVKLESPMLFTVFLYSTTSPIQPIEFTKYKDRLITGTTVVQSSGIINFKKLAIREVSSYQKDGLFNMVIVPEDIRLIQPCIIRDITVKARKMKLWKLKKNLKLDQGVSFSLNK